MSESLAHPRVGWRAFERIAPNLYTADGWSSQDEPAFAGAANMTAGTMAALLPCAAPRRRASRARIAGVLSPNLPRREMAHVASEGTGGQEETANRREQATATAGDEAGARKDPNRA